MRAVLFATFLTFFTSLSGLAQTPVPVQTPPPPADETDVVKITTALIQVDVTVTDKKGNIVRDLRPDEIEVYENGEKQDITKFSFISNVRSSDAPRMVSPNTPGLPPGPVRAENVRRTIALVVDDLTLSFESTYFVRRALKKFVDEQMQPGDLVAIIRTGAGIGALQQFTSDRRQLHAAIERVRWNSLGAGGIGAFAPLEARMRDERQQEEPRPGDRTAEDGEREFDEFRESLFATGTLGAVNYVVRGMQDLPGRKSIMLLSDGFSLVSRDSAGFIQTNRVFESLRRLVDLANRAAVVVYTLDARGLQYTGITAADDLSGRDIQQVENDLNDRRNRILDTQAGLKYLARQTGGLAIVNNNDLSGGIRKILDDQSYYLIGYEPDDSTFDARVRRFNRLEVKVTRPGTTVRYRSGFFGISDERLRRPVLTPAQRLVHALTSPFAMQEVSLRLNALYYNAPKDGNVVRSLVHVRAQDLVFKDTPDGQKQAVFDLIAAGFGDNGTVVDQISKTYTLTVKKEAYENFLVRGFVYDVSFPIKKPGAYQLRVALRDSATDKLGSANQFVEVPNLKKNRLHLSGVVLENLPLAEWRKRDAGQPVSPNLPGPLIDSSLRQFKRGTVLGFGFSIYNPILAPAANLTSQARLYRDGKVIFEGKVQTVPPLTGSVPKSVDFNSAIILGSEMAPGDYVLQVTIVDNLAKAKRNSVTQFVQFEIVE
ncbi:MAG TPA: VWA domain-containing protein [Pyrinomonadaceae bacterium]|nr:VWA domain-containing protein [Pyrinomonadaceae bacterium]